jgi:hypothetical protein
MPTAEAFAAAGGSTRAGIPANAVNAYMAGWDPPSDAAGLLDARGTRDRVQRWLAAWAAEMERTQSVRLSSYAADRVDTKTRTWSIEWAGRDKDVSWRFARLPTATGGTEVIDVGNPANLNLIFKEAVKPGGGGGLGEYSPRNWGDAGRRADILAANWTKAADYVATFAETQLSALSSWYGGQLERTRTRTDAAQAAEADAAIARDAQRRADAEAAEEARRIATRPARMARAEAAAARIFGGEGRTAAKLRAKAEALGPLRARFALQVGAQAIDDAEAAGADTATATAAGEAAAASALGLLDVLYPVEEPAFYAETFAVLPGAWAVLFLAIAYADDPASADLPVADAAYYGATLGDLPDPWKNLFIQYSMQVNQEGA